MTQTIELQFEGLEESKQTSHVIDKNFSRPLPTWTYRLQESSVFTRYVERRCRHISSRADSKCGLMHTFSTAKRFTIRKALSEANYRENILYLAYFQGTNLYSMEQPQDTLPSRDYSVFNILRLSLLRVLEIQCLNPMVVVPAWCPEVLLLNSPE